MDKPGSTRSVRRRPFPWQEQVPKKPQGQMTQALFDKCFNQVFSQPEPDEVLVSARLHRAVHRWRKTGLVKHAAYMRAWRAKKKRRRHE